MKTATQAVGQATALPEILAYQLRDAGIYRGGCTARCSFKVESQYNIRDSGYYVYLQHGRKRHTVRIDKLLMTTARRNVVWDIIDEAEPWLRGLHRFPIECGIK